VGLLLKDRMASGDYKRSLSDSSGVHSLVYTQLGWQKTEAYETDLSG
jgi:hypothetical protein